MALGDWVNVKTGYARKSGYSVTNEVGGQTLLDAIRSSGLLGYLEIMGEQRVAKAGARAINKSLVTLRSITTKQVARILAVRQSKIRTTFEIKKARFERLEGSLRAAGVKAIPLYEFSPSPKTVEAKRPKIGVSVRIRKDRGRVSVPGSFIARVGGGSVGVFERVHADRSYPIRRLYGPAPLSYLLHDEPIQGGEKLIVDQIDDEFAGVFEKNLAHELEFEYTHMPRSAGSSRWRG
jgi:hypothetical protein